VRIVRRPPKVRYAKSGDVSIAWQSVGSGPDLLLVPGRVSHLEYAWEEPGFAAFLDRLASFSRLILLDRRGTGLSDRVAEMPTHGDAAALSRLAGSLTRHFNRTSVT
jgi:pimeloyl-ACP methyl ester carboxylesterase